MGWQKSAALGGSTIDLQYSRTGAFRRHIDGGGAYETFRLSGRHLRIVIRRKRDDGTERRAHHTDATPFEWDGGTKRPAHSTDDKSFERVNY